MEVIKSIGPPGSVPFITFCCLIALVLAFVWPRSGWLARTWLWTVFAGHMILALPVVANGIAGALPPVQASPPNSLRDLNTVFVLDGDNRRGRVRSAVEAAQASPAAAVIVLGGSPWLEGALGEAGIGPNRITYDYRPQDTRAQMDELERQTTGGGRRVAVVASRLQMPRVAGLARAAGLPASLVASPIDTEPPTSGWRLVVPSYYALRVSRDAIYEHAALALYRWRGWIR
jgi:uncharacterized SAM-binding protein YcdF (DUF218 family)